MKNLIFAGIIFCAFLMAGTAHATEPAGVSDFTLVSLDGKRVSLHDYLHKKTIVINFWAAWCEACAEEMPQLLQLKNQTTAADVVFLGINAGDTESRARNFVEKTGYSYLILLDTDKSVAKQFQVLGIPQTLVISKEGKIIYRGGRPPRALDALK